MPQREQDSLFSFENFDLKLDYRRKVQAYRHRTIAYDIQTTATADTFDLTNHQNKNIINIFGSLCECRLVRVWAVHVTETIFGALASSKRESFVGHER